MDEREAILRLKQGDIGGLEALVEIYQTKAVRASYLIIRDHAAAEDIVQGAFLRVYERISQFDATRPFAPWFMRIVVNDTLNVVARGNRQVSIEAAAANGYGGEDYPGLTSAAASAEEILERAETVEVIAATLNQLTASQRAALVMRYYLGMSESEMSRELDCSPGTVKWRLHAARERMRQLLPAWLTPTDPHKQYKD